MVVSLGVGVGVTQVRRLGGDAGPFSPGDLSPFVWYDATAADSIIHAAGSVSQWEDLSGNARHLTQGDGSRQPTTGTATMNGLNAIDFDGTSFMSAAKVAWC